MINKKRLKLWTMPNTWWYPAMIILKCSNGTLGENKSPYLLEIHTEKFTDEVRCIRFASANYGRVEEDGGIKQLAIW